MQPCESNSALSTSSLTRTKYEEQSCKASRTDVIASCTCGEEYTRTRIIAEGAAQRQTL